MYKANLEVPYGYLGFFPDGSEQVCMTHLKTPSKVQWALRSREHDLTVHVNYSKGKQDIQSRRKILWIVESRTFAEGANQLVKENLQEAVSIFEQIWTHDDDLIGLHPSIKRVAPTMGLWIPEEEQLIYRKSKLISMITSRKVFTPQQRFRVDFAEKNRKTINVYGKGFQEIRSKTEGLQEYMFSVAIENDTYDTYFTEKILDCFACGTIPVYKGTRKVTEYFNGNGILFLDDVKDLSTLTKELYISKIPYIIENYQKVKKFNTIDDYVVEKYLLSASVA